MRHPRRLAVAAPLVVMLAATCAAGLEGTPALQHCAQAVAEAGQRYFDQALAARVRCRNRAAAGRIDPSTQCVNGSDDAATAAALQRAGVAFADALGRSCTSEDLATADQARPCFDVASTIEQATACLRTRLDTVIDTLLNAYHPAGTDVLKNRAAACVRGGSLQAMAMLRTELDARIRCLREHGTTAPAATRCRREMPPRSDGTGDAWVDARIVRGQRRLLGGIPSACASADMAAASGDSSCWSAGDSSTLAAAACLFDRNRAAVADVLDLLLPVVPLCGNGVKESGEECDDGASNSDGYADACRLDCRLPSCGDGVVDAGEACDDGNTNVDDDCPWCFQSCGDGLVTTSEECDIFAGPGQCPPGEFCSRNCTCEGWCPVAAEVRLPPEFGAACDDDGDCAAGTCDTGGSGRCATEAAFDLGWTGLGHGADADLGVVNVSLQCQDGDTCGSCAITGSEPAAASCRCRNDSRVACAALSDADAEACGGQPCDCHLGAPTPILAAGTPACMLFRLAEEVTGSIDVDDGSLAMTLPLRLLVFLGSSSNAPCPVCGGRCSEQPQEPCTVDEDCVTGACALDAQPNDGVRGGVCMDGRDDGKSCDVHAVHATFPARRVSDGGSGGGYSLDCMPAAGRNVSGAGLRIEPRLVTGGVELAAQTSCGIAGGECPCRVCTSDPSTACSSDADCASQASHCELARTRSCQSETDCTDVPVGRCLFIGRCELATSIHCTSNADCAAADVGSCTPSRCGSDGSGVAPSPNGCEGGECEDLGGGQGRCAIGPDDSYCDSVLTPEGKGVFACAGNQDCDRDIVHVDGGGCTLRQRRACFPEPIAAEGAAHTRSPAAVAASCVPPTASPAINQTIGLPGPALLRRQLAVRALCAGQPEQEYVPGTAGCAD